MRRDNNILGACDERIEVEFTARLIEPARKDEVLFGRIDFGTRYFFALFHRLTVNDAAAVRFKRNGDIFVFRFAARGILRIVSVQREIARNGGREVVFSVERRIGVPAHERVTVLNGRGRHGNGAAVAHVARRNHVGRTVRFKRYRVVCRRPQSVNLRVGSDRFVEVERRRAVLVRKPAFEDITRLGGRIRLDDLSALDDGLPVHHAAAVRFKRDGIGVRRVRRPFYVDVGIRSHFAERVLRRVRAARIPAAERVAVRACAVGALFGSCGYGRRIARINRLRIVSRAVVDERNGVLNALPLRVEREIAQHVFRAVVFLRQRAVGIPPLERVVRAHGNTGRFRPLRFVLPRILKQRIVFHAAVAERAAAVHHVFNGEQLLRIKRIERRVRDRGRTEVETVARARVTPCQEGEARLFGRNGFDKPAAEHRAHRFAVRHAHNAVVAD